VKSDEPRRLRFEDVLDRVRVRVSRQTIRNWIRRQQFPAPQYDGLIPYWAEPEMEEWERQREK
jgi:hypothetical protein